MKFQSFQEIEEWRKKKGLNQKKTWILLGLKEGSYGARVAGLTKVTPLMLEVYSKKINELEKANS